MKNLLVFLVLLSITASAQESRKVMEPIHRLFEAMQLGDSAMLHRAFHPEATLFTVLNDPKTNQPSLRKETLAPFLKSIGTPHKEVYNELIWGEKIDIDGDFAQVWVDYAFYLGKTFSHCGVDAFQLIRNPKGEWLIFVLSDTRRKVGCDVPKEVSDRVK
jgi:hypothetical protein